MNMKLRGLMLLLLLAVLLIGVTAANAAANGPARHPPSCIVVKTTDRSIILGVWCTDRGGDITEAVITDASRAVSWDADIDGRSAFLQVYRPADDDPLTLAWAVTDKQGNQVVGKFTWPLAD